MSNPIPEAWKSHVEGIKSYALTHYEEDGWDFLIESYEDLEIIEMLERWDVSPESPFERVIEVAKDVMSLHDERRWGNL